MEARGGRTSNRRNKSPLSTKCNGFKCESCKEFKEDDYFKSSISGKTYRIRSNVKVNCRSENLIYLVTCKNCQIQYVGQTGQALCKRFSGHRSKIKNCTNGSNNMIFSRHFSEGDCKNKEYEVQIIEKLNGNGRLLNGKIDENDRRYREKREEFWIKEMKTVFPYGLNNRLHKNLDQRNEIDDPVYKDFNAKRVRGKRRGNNQRSGNRLTATMLWNHLRNKDVNGKIKAVLKYIPQMKKDEIKKFGVLNQESNAENYQDQRVKDIIDDRIISKLLLNTSNKKQEKKTPTHFCKVVFDNKCMERIALQKILRSQEVLDTIPGNFNFRSEPTVIYKYVPPIRNKIFNYNGVFDNFSRERWLADEENIPCTCEGSKFKNEDHGHVITGDLRIVQNAELRKLLTKGPNFREGRKHDLDKTFKLIKEGIEEYAENWAKKENKNKNLLNEWKAKVLDKVKMKTEKLKDTRFYNDHYPKRTLSKKKPKDELARLQDLYVMVPVDKASNNVSFICKKFYIKKVLEEVDSSTYEKIDRNPNEILDELADKTKNKYGLDVDNGEMMFPKIHMIPKMHKNPVGFRFIIASKKNPLKKTAKTLTKILKVVLETHKAYCRKIKLYTGINRMWICQNNTEIIQEMENVSRRRGARNVTSFDFSTLYTKINLEDLRSSLKWTVDRAFKGGNNQKITVGKYDTKWGNRVKGVSYTKDQIYDMIDDIVMNAYFQVGDVIYRQIIGIPMGIDPAPFMANLYLYKNEFEYMEDLTKRDYGKALKFNKMYRFIDDLCGVNNDGLMEQHWNEIYPDELILKKENESDLATTFLDLDVRIEDKKLKTKLYDKRDDFKFKIVSYPDLSSNIPKAPAYGVFIAQLLRIFRTCSSLDDANHRIILLSSKLANQGYSVLRMAKDGRRTLDRHQWICRKFKCKIHEMMELWSNTWIWAVTG